MPDVNVKVEAPPQDFIREIVSADVAAGHNGGRVVTRFPPEPNGYLHIGHAKAICVDFGIAADFDGTCNLRFDDTNPVKEDVEYVDSIKDDVRWLGFDWGRREFYASDYYEQLYAFAERLISKGVAYVDSLSADEIRAHRGTLTQPGSDSPYRTAASRRTWICSVACVPASSPTARTCCGRRSTWHPQHHHARSGALPHPARAPSPDGRRMVHLSDVRLRSSAV